VAVTMPGTGPVMQMMFKAVSTTVLNSFNLRALG
jgi:hypothetical protein